MSQLGPEVSLILDQFPGPVVMRVTTRKLILIGMLGLLVTLVFGLLLKFGVCPKPAAADEWFDRAMWSLCALLLGLFALLGVVLGALSVAGLITIHARMRLILDAEGLECGFSWSPRSYRRKWEDVSGFRPIIMKFSGVGFLDAGRRPGSDTRLLGINRTVLETFGLRHFELADLLLQWRERALSSRGIRPTRKGTAVAAGD